MDALDLNRFKLAYGRPAAYNSIFDYNGDSRIDAYDLMQLRLRTTARILR